MKILAISYLFPNSITPNFGVFVLNRLKHVNCVCQVKIINPIPWFPFSFLFERYRRLAQIPKKEILGGMEIFHPRFFIIPRFFKFIDAVTFAMAVIPLAFKIKKKFKFDIIDLHWTYPDLLAGRILSRMTKKRQLVTIRGKEALCIGESSPRARIIQQCLQGSNRIITLSEELKFDVQRMGVAGKKIVTIRNGVDTHSFRYINKEKCRKRLGLPLDTFILLSVGSLIFRKGHDRVIKHLKHLLIRQSNICLYIIGSQGPEGDFRKNLKTLIKKLSLEDHVCFVGDVKNQDLIYWYNSADLFCLMSRGEGSPNVLTEALACGCPSVATRVGAVPDILDEYFMGTLAPNDDQLSLSAFMEASKKNYDRPHIADYMRSFGWEWCAQNVIDIYGELKNKK